MGAITQKQADPSHLLIVDDAPQSRDVVGHTLRGFGYVVSTAQSGDEAVAILDARVPDLVVIDLKKPALVGGMELLRHVRARHPQAAVLMVTGYPCVPGAVELIKTRAGDYLEKPFSDQELLRAVESALERMRLRSQGVLAMPENDEHYGMLGDSRSMRAVFRAISKAAASQATVLITGESGTGKELVARAIHENGARASAPFVPINCSRVTESLMESELFGHVRGAFTGAATTRGGLLQAADGGSLFLDEIGDIGPAMQAAFLRVLQDGEVRMVGSSRSRKTDVRILAATNKDLDAALANGTFREDLFYRLKVIPIELPPLRARGDDVPLLIRHFVDSVARELGRPRPSLSADSYERLCSYPWPGNVRELQNVVRRLLIMSEGETIELSDLPSNLQRPDSWRGLASGHGRSLADVEREHIRKVLASVGGNKSRAARILGIDRKTLRTKIRNAHPARSPVCSQS